jgi:hypothetical protein
LNHWEPRLPGFIESAETILDRTSSPNFEKSYKHWDLYSSEIRLTTARIESAFLNLEAIAVQAGGSPFNAFDPMMTSSDLFPVAGRPFDCDFFLAIAFSDLKTLNNLHYLINGIETKSERGLCSIHNIPFRPGTQTFKVHATNPGSNPNIDLEQEFKISIPPPCPTSN